jgi:hypothetical protein
MKKRTLLIAGFAFFPVSIFAAGENNVGSCGWGAKLLDGQRGVASQVLAATTNGTSGNQTFGISSGTSGCTQDGVVSSNWKTAMYIDGNKEKLARDMSIGSGETLDSLAQLIGVQKAHMSAFYRVTQENFAKIFSSENSTTSEVMVSLRQVLAADDTLAQYAVAI